MQSTLNPTTARRGRTLDGDRGVAHGHDRGSDRRGDGGILLADAMSANALFSGLTGAALVLGAPWLDGVLDLHAAILAGLGVGLVGFAVVILAVLAQPTVIRQAARITIVADIAWVVAAGVVIATDLLPAAAAGPLVASTVVVAGFAIVQTVGLRRAGNGAALGLRPVTMTAAEEADTTIAQAWSRVADAAGHADAAPGLAHVATDGEVADGMVRTCTDDAGRQWSETCTLVAPGLSYRMDVDVSTYPLRYRAVLHDFGMTWRVSPTDRGARLQLTFAGTTMLGLLGRLAIAVFGRDDPARHIVAAHARALDTPSTPATHTAPSSTAPSSTKPARPG